MKIRSKDGIIPWEFDCRRFLQIGDNVKVVNFAYDLRSVTDTRAWDDWRGLVEASGILAIGRRP